MTAEDDDLPELVTERRALREELKALRERDAGNILALDPSRRGRTT